MLEMGKGNPENDPVSLRYSIQKEGLFTFLVDDTGQWTERNDVRYTRVMSSGLKEAKVYVNGFIFQ
jgi:hypothetical protein